jgi:hypothetical protein
MSACAAVTARRLKSGPAKPGTKKAITSSPISLSSVASWRISTSVAV